LKITGHQLFDTFKIINLHYLFTFEVVARKLVSL